MAQSDEHNVLLVESVDSVDEINAGFYGRFPYPWPPVKFERLEDPRFYADMLNQELGAWGRDRVPADGRIWVAGCGTNQAVFTALRFPGATVVGSDVSATSLEICGATARALGIKNLELRRESLNHITYREQFDYVLCTGVIHHNADPAATLARIAGALRPTGVLELMVYNRFHWVIPVAFQQAIRMLCAGRGSVKDFEGELSVTRRIMADPPPSLLLRSYLGRYGADSPESMLADELLQPVIYSYTVESLQEMAAGCGLELLLPCLNQFDKAAGTPPWNLDFDDPVTRELYEALPDARRWQITNLLLLENAPMLWFYVQRKDSPFPRRSEREVCDEFLDAVFARATTAQRNYVRTEDGGYEPSPNAAQFPIAAPPAPARLLLEAADGRSTMRELFARVGLDTTFREVNRARLQLTTPAHPYLRASAAGARAVADLAAVDTERLAADKFEKFKGVRPRAVRLTPGG